MSKVSSVRWNNPNLFEHVKAYAELHHEKVNAVIIDAVTEYLKNRVPQISKLRSQTIIFSEKSSEMNEWSKGQDTRGWE
jgi:hypothetical protein